MVHVAFNECVGDPVIRRVPLEFAYSSVRDNALLCTHCADAHSDVTLAQLQQGSCEHEQLPVHVIFA